MITASSLPLIAIILGGIATVAGVLALVRQHAMSRRLRVFLQGRDGQSLEEALRRQIEKATRHDADIEELRKASEYLHKAIQASLRKVAIERYNPFAEVGSNQSFTIALLDAHNSGVVITSLHSRDATRVYAKAIRNGAALQHLSGEEERTVKNALLMKGA